ncbi:MULTISPECIES: SRPBCC family protein [unclassified Sinorhizobium]|uniref:SRPBCC family protein n=1 Tax=unclassified Sinorhizobium TaxID=2613772 RepID=UPI0024C35D75|nr:MULTISPECIES: SRPBCC family protein [unclassified Sinorhizobium]MDK1376924.1 SRPBCC family protein [Sinorhizobium sp. 6-70]MDK1479247.1 SRPBCC family protein [Sinorhizobium sp. 6-117]
MTDEAARGRTDTASRAVRAPVQTIYRALLDPAAVAVWLPPDGMRGKIERFEAREGGVYRMALIYEEPSLSTRGKTSASTDIVEGRFVQLVPDERVVQRVEFESDDPAFAGMMTITWTLATIPDGTLVTVTCESVPSGISKQDHDKGLRSTLANLAAFTETE